MTLTRLATHHSRAVIALTLLLGVAGVVSGLSLPSSIYPPLQFPRIVAVAHAGTTPAQSMMLTVTRPIEQAIMEVPGIRRVRSRTFRGATEISAQFDPPTDMVVARNVADSLVGLITPDGAQPGWLCTRALPFGMMKGTTHRAGTSRPPGAAQCPRRS